MQIGSSGSWVIRSASATRQQLQSVAVGWADGGEGAVIEGQHDGGVEALGESDHRGVNASEGEVGVSINERGDSVVVLRDERLDILVAQGPPEGSLSRRSEAFGNQLSSLDRNRSRNDKAQVTAAEDRERSSMGGVALISRREQRAGVSDRDCRRRHP